MEWDRQISGYFDRTLTAEETQALYAWLREDAEHLRRFASAAVLHRGLLDHFRAQQQLQEQASLAASMTDAMILPALQEEEAAPVTLAEKMAYIELPRRPAEQPRSPRRHRWRAAAALAFLVAGLAICGAWPRGSEARVVAVDRLQWQRGETPVGARLPRGEVALETGLLKLGFTNGNEVIVEGPARFEVLGEREILLHRGRLSAVVSEPGRGLLVSTPDARVTDLGTEFGISTLGGVTRVAVFQGKVTAAPADAALPLQEQVISTGSGAEVSQAGVKALPLAALSTGFARAMPSEIRRLNLVDLLAGGDGTGEVAEIGIDAATGAVGKLPAVAGRRATGEYTRVAGHRFLDGTFIPSGPVPVNSAGHRFTFPGSAPTSYGLIWAGVQFPWAREPRIFTTLAGEDFTRQPSQLLVLHSNNALTIDLAALRAAHPQGTLLAFQSRVGNSFVTGTPGELGTPPRASIHVLVDGIARFEKLNFTNEFPPFDVTCPLTSADRFLTLATTDGGDGFTNDWVLWTHPRFELRTRNDPSRGPFPAVP